MNKNNQTNNQLKLMSDARVKYFLQMLDVKSDTNMTRVYTAIKQSEFLRKNK